MVSSCYPVFAGKNPEMGIKVLAENFNLKVEHHFSSEILEYYVLVDANGNHMDLMRHNMVEDMGFFGMRLNVDDFDAMVAFLKGQGYEFAFGPFDAPSAIVAVMSNPSNPNAHRYVVSHHKKDWFFRYPTRVRAGHNPMVGATVAVAVAIEEAAK